MLKTKLLKRKKKTKLKNKIKLLKRKKKKKPKNKIKNGRY